MKKKVFVFAAAVICLAILASGTLAFFTAEEEIHNVITTGGVDIMIEEWHETAAGIEPYPVQTLDVVPGDSESKIVTIKNLDADAWVRAQFTIAVDDANGNQKTLTPEQAAELVSFTGTHANWIRKTGDSTWWYYNTALTEGASTEALFDTVEFSATGITEEHQGCTFRVVITAEAVQSANNGAVVTDAAWS